VGPLAVALVALVALLHLGFMVLETFHWKHPVGRSIFGTSAEFAERSAPLAANQGLYNGFLAAGLAWGIIASRADVTIFFLCCVIVAGAYGAISVKRTILFVQALPGAGALIAVLLA
jgi:putative membrane protein